MIYRFHVIGLPHTQATQDYSNCAFTQNMRKFCRMMRRLGHWVALYASEDCDVSVDEHVSCITKREQLETCRVDGPATILHASYERHDPHWTLFNRRAIEALRERVQPRDFLAIIAGDLNQEVIDAFPQALAVEYAVGYTGIAASTHRAFASYAWLHTLYGRYYGAHATQGRFYDRVIPHAVDLAEFTFSESKDNYVLFVGRLNEDKGVRVAADAARIAGVPLVVAGQGPVLPDGVNYRGLVGPAERARLMSRARALVVPSLYLEPFGMVAIEALASGTPIITTDWGGLAEINQGGVGFRCHTLQDFVTAIRRAGEVDPRACWRRAKETFSLESVSLQYADYFRDLYGLWGDGWTAAR